MKLDQFEEELLKDSEFRKYQEQYHLSHNIGIMVVEARILLGLTQSKLAELAGTKQANISRLENGDHLPSLSMLERVANALKARLVIQLEFLEDIKITSSSNAKTKFSLSTWTSSHNNISSYNHSTNVEN